MNQHDRDSRELRELCAQRDAARATVRQQSERIAELELQPAFAQLASDLAVKLADTEAERDRLRAELAEQAAIYGAATHIHSELRSIVQAGGSDEAIGRAFRKRVLPEIADVFASLREEVESLRAVSDEYNHWVRFHAAGDGDYDDFIVTHCRHDNARTTHKETE